MEQGMALLAVAHLEEAARQAQQRRLQLAPRFVRAQESRPKLTDISDGRIEPVGWRGDAPAALRQQIFDEIGGATFVGKGVKSMVQQMCFGFEWTMKMAMEQAAAADPKSGLTLDPSLRRSKRKTDGASAQSVRV